MKHLVTVKQVSSPDGAKKPTYSVWNSQIPGRLRDVSGGEVINGEQIEAHITHIFETRYYSGLRHDMILEYDGTTYNIDRILDRQGTKRFLDVLLVSREN